MSKKSLTCCIVCLQSVTSWKNPSLKAEELKKPFSQTQDELRRCTEDQCDEGIFYTVNHAK